LIMLTIKGNIVEGEHQLNQSDQNSSRRFLVGGAYLERMWRPINHHDAELQCTRIDIHGENEFVNAMKLNVLNDLERMFDILDIGWEVLLVYITTLYVVLFCELTHKHAN
jgi:hypothetical protein